MFQAAKQEQAVVVATPKSKGTGNGREQRKIPKKIVDEEAQRTRTINGSEIAEENDGSKICGRSKPFVMVTAACFALIIAVVVATIILVDNTGDDETTAPPSIPPSMSPIFFHIG